MVQELDDTVNVYFLKYQKFIETNIFFPKITKCLFINAFNHFLAAQILADRGLIPQVNNCLRMGLESEWIGIILQKNKKLAFEWAFGAGDEITRKNLLDLERPFKIREALGDTSKIKLKDRHEIYSALSDKSHTKLSSVARFFIPKDVPASEGYIDCIPYGGVEGDNNKFRIRSAVKVTLEFALAEIQESLQYPFFDEDWVWNRVELSKISEAGYSDENGKFEPYISSKGHPERDPAQLIASLSAIRHGEI